MLTPNDKKDIQMMIEKAISQSEQFQTKKRGDLPTDGYHLTPEKYVDANGTIANRPPQPFTGQQYFATSPGYPWFFNGTNWVSATGSIVSAQ
jgi:hypothetical protein